MSKEVIGDIEVYGSLIKWSIPRFIIPDVHKKGFRILSPKIDLATVNSSNMQFHLQNPNKWMGLGIISDYPGENKFVRLGMVNDRNEEICSCYDARREYENCTFNFNFWVPRILQFSKFGELLKERDDFYLRIFYEEIENVFEKGNTSIYVSKDTGDIGNKSEAWASIIKWTIPGSLLTAAHKKGLRALSPKIDLEFYNRFKHEREKWSILFHDIYLYISIDPPPERLNKFVRLGLVNDRDEEISSSYGTWNPSKEMVQGNKRYFPSLDIIKNFELEDFFENRGGCYLRIYCEVMENIFEDGHASTDAGKVAGNDVANKPLKSKENELDFNTEEAEENSRKLKCLTKLSQNLKQMYIGSKHSDTKILVKDREFKVHKDVLRARSPVFDAMFSHDLSESKDGIIPIEDCEPDVFEEFLLFVYSGTVDNLTSGNVCEMYYLSDKYDLPELKEICLRFLYGNVTCETICDIICLSTKHNEAKLLEHAIKFFSAHLEEILVSVKWQLFLKENPVVANELYIKALKLGFMKKEN